MKWFRLNTWCWYHYFKPTQKDFRYKLRIPIVFLLSVLLYELLAGESSVICIIVVVCLGCLLAFYPKLLITAFLITIILVVVKHFINVSYIDRYLDGEYTVISRIKMGPIIKVEGHRVLVHSKLTLNTGDVISLTGHVVKIKNTNKFDLSMYLKTKQIMSQIYPNDLSVKELSHSFLNRAHAYIENGSKTWKSIAPLLLLGEHTEHTKTLFEITKKLSIVHLFVISGFHIGIIHKVVASLFKKMKIYCFDIFALLPLIIYVFLLNWTIPAIRALLFISLITFKNKIKPFKKFSNVDVLGFVGILLMCVNPYISDSISFKLTFLASTTIIYLNGFSIKSKLIK